MQLCRSWLLPQVGAESRNLSHLALHQPVHPGLGPEWSRGREELRDVPVMSVAGKKLASTESRTERGSNRDWTIICPLREDAWATLGSEAGPWLTFAG